MAEVHGPINLNIPTGIPLLIFFFKVQITWKFRLHQNCLENALEEDVSFQFQCQAYQNVK